MPNNIIKKDNNNYYTINILIKNYHIMSADNNTTTTLTEDNDTSNNTTTTLTENNNNDVKNGITMMIAHFTKMGETVPEMKELADAIQKGDRVGRKKLYEIPMEEETMKPLRQMLKVYLEWNCVSEEDCIATLNELKEELPNATTYLDEGMRFFTEEDPKDIDRIVMALTCILENDDNDNDNITLRQIEDIIDIITFITQNLHERDNNE